MTKYLTMGVVGKSLKENEKRVAIHPEHVKRIPKELRELITFEKEYGLRFGMDDNTLAKLTSGRVASKEEILKGFDCVLIPKPLAKDLYQVQDGAIVWGWPHCVQQKEITQISIDKKLTLIAWEEMFIWNQTGGKQMHIFYKNNEIAGYAGVNHATSLIGTTGNYGKTQKAVVLGYGSVSRGAIYALQGQGFKDITVYTDFPAAEAKDKLPGIPFKQIKNDDSGNMVVVESNGTTLPLSKALLDVHIIVNAVLQDVSNPKMFISARNADKLMKGTLIIDISCDEGMGFWCAKPTSFKNPIFEVNGISYYAVDHSPSWYWNSSSWEISDALLPYLSIVLGGAIEWDKNKTISKSIEIDKGVIQNPKILSFQNRKKEYPHQIW
jgi:N5-(carboxyethyl)ornithine synthase